MRVSDAADTLTDDGSCVPAGVGAADCPSTGTVSLVLGDGDDTLSAAASPVPLSVEAGGGDDTIDIANGQFDAVWCGDGVDDASHADPEDALDAGCEVVSPAAGPPDTSILTRPGAVTHDRDGLFTFGATRPADFQCAFDSAVFSACDRSFTFPGLADGGHALLVRAVDLVGNADPSPAAYDFVVDTVAPTVTLTTTPAALTNHATADFAFTTNETPATMECRLDDAAAWTACDTLTATRYLGSPRARTPSPCARPTPRATPAPRRTRGRSTSPRRRPRSPPRPAR